jgi:acylglycerol lipase
MRRPLLPTLLVLLSVALAAGCSTPPEGAYQPMSPIVKGLPSGVRHDTDAIATKDGLTLFEQRWSPTATARATLVIEHGLKDHSSRYAAFATRLAARGIAVRAADLRGHGRSSGPRVWVEPFANYTDDLGLVVARARAAAPARPVFLLGHSMGGCIATLYALDHQADLAGLVLSAPALVANVNVFTRGITRMTAGMNPGAGVFQLDLHDFSRDPQVVEEGLADPLVYQEGAAARTAVELLNALEQIDDRAEEMKLPFLALHGDQDVVTEPDGSRMLLERAASKDKTLKIYEGYKHDLLHEPGADKEKVAADIEAWIEARIPKGQ